MGKLGVIVAYNLKAKRKNIGDYIQTLAAMQFAQNRDIEYLDRDALDDVKGYSLLKTIMNGWYMLKPKSFPPSGVISPLYVSFHLAPFIAKSFFTSATVEHLKNNEPIGCRDFNTMRMMKQHGIDAYFSGCLTLTLNYCGRYSDRQRTNEVYIVDPYVDEDFTFSPFAMVKRFVRYSKANILHKEEIMKIAVQIRQTTKTYTNKKSLIKYATKIYSTYSKVIDVEVLSNAIYEEHVVPMSFFVSEEDKFKYAKQLLHKYANAKFVITSRIHCALPCLALETPVVFISAKDMERKFKPTRPSGRLEGLVELFRNICVVDGSSTLNEADFMDVKKITSDYRLPNKENYIVYREKLINTVIDFLNN